jgi:hypothetical protein
MSVYTPVFQKWRVEVPRDSVSWNVSGIAIFTNLNIILKILNLKPAPVADDVFRDVWGK